MDRAFWRLVCGMRWPCVSSLRLRTEEEIERFLKEQWISGRAVALLPNPIFPALPMKRNNLALFSWRRTACVTGMDTCVCCFV